MKSSLKLLLAFLLMLILSSCFALQNFSKNTKTSQSYALNNIFLDPKLLSEKKVYLNFRNSTIYEDFNLFNEIKNKLKSKGIEVVDENMAPIHIQVNLRYYGLFETEILNAMLEDKTKKDALTEKSDFEDFSGLKKRSKYDVDFSGIALGGIIGFASMHTIYGAVLGGILIGAGAIFFESFYESKMVLAMLDISISEKLKNNKEIIVEDFRQVSHGMGGTRKESLQYKSNYQTFQTKVIVVSKNALINDENGIKDVKKQIIGIVSGLI
jgi:hypothetical protein